MLCSGLNAAITITFDQIGNDVVSYYSGTLNTNDPKIFDNSALVSAYNFNPSLGYYTNQPSGWRTFSGSYVVDNSSSNSPFYDGPRLGSGSGLALVARLTRQKHQRCFWYFPKALVLPDDWISGSNISGQMTWANTSLDSLGIDTSQVHTWTLEALVTQ